MAQLAGLCGDAMETQRRPSCCGCVVPAKFTRHLSQPGESGNRQNLMQFSQFLGLLDHILWLSKKAQVAKKNPIPNTGIELCVKKKNQNLLEWISCFSPDARCKDFPASGVQGDTAETFGGMDNTRKQRE